MALQGAATSTPTIVTTTSIDNAIAIWADMDPGSLRVYRLRIVGIIEMELSPFPFISPTSCSFMYSQESPKPP